MKLLRPLAGCTLYDHIRRELQITGILDKIDGTGFYTCKECHKTDSLSNHTITDHREGEQLEDRRNVGKSSCNSGDGTDQMVQSLMFMMMTFNEVLGSAVRLRIGPGGIVKISGGGGVEGGHTYVIYMLIRRIALYSGHLGCDAEFVDSGVSKCVCRQGLRSIRTFFCFSFLGMKIGYEREFKLRGRRVWMEWILYSGWDVLWDTWRSQFMMLCKLGFIMDQCS
jgi:hypothetical protein